MMRSRGYVARLEMTAPAEPARPWPNAGRTVPFGEKKD
jgi:hypothetical protein